MKNRLLVISTALAVVLGVAFLAVTSGGGTARGQVQLGSGSLGCEPDTDTPTPTATVTPTPTRTYTPTATFTPIPPTATRHTHAHQDLYADAHVHVHPADAYLHTHAHQDLHADTDVNARPADAYLHAHANKHRHADGAPGVSGARAAGRRARHRPLRKHGRRAAAAPAHRCSTRIYWAKLAANNLVDSLAGTGGSLSPHRVAVISFAGDATATLNLALNAGTTASAVHSAINSITTGGSTYIAPALTSRHQPANHTRAPDRHEGRHPAIRRQKLGQFWGYPRRRHAPGQHGSAAIGPLHAAADTVYSVGIGTDGLRVFEPRRAPASGHREVPRGVHQCD